MLGRGDLIGVTGATGQVGRIFCREARREGYRLRCLGRNLEGLPDDVETVALDLAAPQDIDPAPLRDCRAVVHLAAYIPKDHKSLEEAGQCWAVNVLGTVRLIGAMAKAGVRRFVQLSSASAYSIWSGRTDENAPLFPASRTFYLGSKITQEIAAMEACAEHGISFANLRVSSVYGADAGTSIIARFARQLLSGEPIELVDEGAYGADFVFAADVARAILMVLHDGTIGELNVASGNRTTLAEIAKELQRLTGAPNALIRLLPARERVDVGFPAIQIDRALALGYTPTPISEGIKAVLRSLRQPDRRP